jgi:hypothetical protein
MTAMDLKSPIVLAGRALILLTFVLRSLPLAQAQVSDLFRTTNGTFGSHVEYHNLRIGPGSEVVLADISGPGKIVLST